MSDDLATVFAPITKMAPQPDGSLLVHGKATGSDLDLDQQRCGAEWLSRAVPEWFKIGNIRESHDPHRAVGKATEHDVRDDGHYITAKIVDPVAVAKAQAGIFTGFSIGIKNPRITKSADAPNGTITDGRIVEVSIVDAPCLPTATLTLMKAATPGMEINAADFDEERGLVRCEELVEKAVDTAVEPEEPSVPTLAETLAPEALEKLAAAVEPTEVPAAVVDSAVIGSAVAALDNTEKAVEKATDTAPLEQDSVSGTPLQVISQRPIGGDGGDTAPTFGKAAALELVAASLAKAEGDDMATFAPISDEDLATTALSIIARLIQSEAGNMVANPGEDDDIRCLLSAVASLRWYVRRERQEGDVGGTSDAAPYEYAEMAATPDTEKASDPASPEVAPEPVVEKTVAPEYRNDGGDLLDPNRALPVKTRSDSNPAPVVEKTVEPDTSKAADVTADEPDADALVKALTAALSKSDNPLRKTFQDIVTASTETTAQAVTELTARLVKVESMAVPGGPALRRTEIERTSARVNDLAGQVRHYKSLEAATHDQTLRKGYAATAAQLETELKALSV